MNEVEGIRALVTGATSGLGLAMARALVDAGARVAITSRDVERAGHVAADLGHGAFGLALDARDESAVAAGVAEVWERLGAVDLLVNNVGTGMRTVNPGFLSDPQPFWAVSPDGFRDVLDTKVTGCFLMARSIVPLMLEQGGGRIVTISMSETTMVRRGFVPYGPSGAAVEALSRVMAADLAGTSVTVYLLLPGGATDTGMIPDDTPAEPANGCSLPRSWDRRSSGSPLRQRLESMTSGSSPPSSSGGSHRDERQERSKPSAADGSDGQSRPNQLATSTSFPSASASVHHAGACASLTR